MEIRKKYRFTNDVAQPTQKKETLVGSAHHLQMVGRDSRDRDKVEVEVAKMKSRSGPYKIRPNPHLVKERD
jgi:hypothetical protein